MLRLKYPQVYKQMSSWYYAEDKREVVYSDARVDYPYHPFHLERGGTVPEINRISK